MNNYQQLDPYQQKPVEYKINVPQPEPTPQPVQQPTPVPQPIPQPVQPPIEPKKHIQPPTPAPKPKRKKLRIFLLILLGVFIGIILITTIFYFSSIPDRIYNSGTLYTQQTGIIRFSDAGVIKEVSLEAYCQNLNGGVK